MHVDGKLMTATLMIGDAIYIYLDMDAHAYSHLQSKNMINILRKMG